MTQPQHHRRPTALGPDDAGWCPICGHLSTDALSGLAAVAFACAAGHVWVYVGDSRAGELHWWTAEEGGDD